MPKLHPSYSHLLAFLTPEFSQKNPTLCVSKKTTTHRSLFFFPTMCPLRFILVFFSAILAGYFAWRTVCSSPETDIFDSDVSTAEKISSKDKQEFHLKQVILNGFWGFIDMASGRYLWRNLREMMGDEKVKSC